MMQVQQHSTTQYSIPYTRACLLQPLFQLFSWIDNLSSQLTLIHCFSSLQLHISKRSNNEYFQPTLQIGFFPQWKTSLVQAVEPAQLYAPLPVAGTTQFAHPTYYIYYLFYAAAFKQQLATTITLHCQLYQHQPTTRNTAALLRWKFQTSFSHAMYFTNVSIQSKVHSTKLRLNMM